MTPIRVLLADDQALVRGGLRKIVDTEADMQVVAEAADGLDAVDAAARSRPDVAVVDIRMPKLDGIEATRRILAGPAGEGVRVLIVTTFGGRRCCRTWEKSPTCIPPSAKTPWTRASPCVRADSLVVAKNRGSPAWLRRRRR
jgi:chemotaxis response regulator CheB